LRVRIDVELVANEVYRVETGGLFQASVPLGLYTSFSVNAPCGLRAVDGVIGLLDMPDTFLDPGRVKAGLLWFTGGFVEYRFPYRSEIPAAMLRALEFSMELGSDAPGTSPDWPSEISLWVNDAEIGSWTLKSSRHRAAGPRDSWGRYGSDHGDLTNWRVTHAGTFLDGIRISSVTLADLKLEPAQPIRLRIVVAANATHPGGVNIFGRGFGHHDQEIVMRLNAEE
jgi:predicted transcriptional regulator